MFSNSDYVINIPANTCTAEVLYLREEHLSVSYVLPLPGDIGFPTEQLSVNENATRQGMFNALLTYLDYVEKTEECERKT